MRNYVSASETASYLLSDDNYVQKSVGSLGYTNLFEHGINLTQEKNLYTALWDGSRSQG